MLELCSRGCTCIGAKRLAVLKRGGDKATMILHVLGEVEDSAGMVKSDNNFNLYSGILITDSIHVIITIHLTHSVCS